MELLDGKYLSATIKDEIRDQVDEIKRNNGKTPHLAAILVGSDGASQTYVNHKVKACAYVGFESTLVNLENSVSEEELLRNIYQLNDNPEIDGFIVQLPLPGHIKAESVITAIKPAKDVDGFHPVNVGRMVQNLPCYLPATPFGIMTIFERYGLELEGKHCTILGRSNIVGRPMSILMSRNEKVGNCTVTLCHSRTKNLVEEAARADILIVALGKPESVTADMVKEGAVVVDVGISRVEDESAKRGYRLQGDVKFDEVAAKASYITPVPGGVGPMTVISLLTNTLKASKREIYTK